MLQLFLVGGKLQLKYPGANSPVRVLNAGLISVHRAANFVRDRSVRIKEKA